MIIIHLGKKARATNIKHLSFTNSTTGFRLQPLSATSFIITVCLEGSILWEEKY